MKSSKQGEDNVFIEPTMDLAHTQLQTRKFNSEIRWFPALPVCFKFKQQPYEIHIRQYIALSCLVEGVEMVKVRLHGLPINWKLAVCISIAT